jgi:hypothetical protein
MRRYVIALLLLASSTALADAQTAVPDPARVDPTLASPLPVRSFQTFRTEMLKYYALEALRNKGLKLQAADGGTLTAQDHAYLQARYRAILNGDY